MHPISGGNEYCPFETFKAECPQDEIIMITEAQYGRMRKGRCVQDGLGKYNNIFKHLRLTRTYH